MKPDPDIIDEVRRRMAAGEPLHEIEDRLDYREQNKPAADAAAKNE